MQDIGVFIDRDGTISEEVGYINHLSRFQIYPWSSQAIYYSITTVSKQSW
jgi:D-glycero-D-manno-heptose 1,7-bisphosphate phosphatase